MVKFGGGLEAYLVRNDMTRLDEHELSEGEQDRHSPFKANGGHPISYTEVEGHISFHVAVRISPDFVWGPYPTLRVSLITDDGQIFERSLHSHNDVGQTICMLESDRLTNDFIKSNNRTPAHRVRFVCFSIRLHQH